jgi:hypothetical protein
MDMAVHFAAECVWCRQCHVTQANAKRERGHRMKMLAEYLENAIKFEQMAAEEKDATPPFPTTSSKASSTRFARRVSTFDRQALADIKRFVNKVSLPADEEFPPQMDAFWEAAARPALEARASKARSKTGCNNAPTSNYIACGSRRRRQCWVKTRHAAQRDSSISRRASSPHMSNRSKNVLVFVCSTAPRGMSA